MAVKPFASSADVAAKEQVLEVLGASAYHADVIVAHANMRALVAERGQQDWESELGRMPRLFDTPDSIPGADVADADLLDPGHHPARRAARRSRPRVRGAGPHRGRHRRLAPPSEILFAGDLVESAAALYTGDAYHREWSTTTLDRVAAYGAETLVGGRGAIARGRAEVDAAIAQTRHFLDVMITEVGGVQRGGGTLKSAFAAAHAALVDQYGGWPIFEHCLPFDVARRWDELAGIERPVIWMAARDQEVWAQLQG